MELLLGSSCPVSVCLVGSVSLLSDLMLMNVCDSIWWTPALIIVTCLLKVNDSIVSVAQLLTLGRVSNLLHARGSLLVQLHVTMRVYLRNCRVCCGQLSCFYVATMLDPGVLVSVVVLGYWLTYVA